MYELPCVDSTRLFEESGRHGPGGVPSSRARITIDQASNCH